MVVLPFRRQGNVGNVQATSDYVQVSPVDKDVAAALFRLAQAGTGSRYWIKKEVLDDALAQLGKGGLETRLLREIEAFGMSASRSKERLAGSIVYNYDAQRGLVLVSPIPRAIGAGAEEYFVRRGQKYAGRHHRKSV